MEPAFKAADYSLPGAIRLQQNIKGWSGSGFDQQFIGIEGSYHSDGGVARINVEIINLTNGRRYSRLSGMTLTKAQGEELACHIAPKFNNYDAMVKALRDLYDALDSSVELTPEVMHQARAALASVDAT